MLVTANTSHPSPRGSRKQPTAMATPVKKYNPGFLSDDEIINAFCVRTNEFESIVESLRESTGNSNPHTIVIGPRGSGKTHLLVRVAAQVRRDESLDAFFPIVFPEESYEISNVGEFWLECLYHLAQQAPTEERTNLNLSYDDLRTETKDEPLVERCLGALLDFADRQHKRLLLVVENLNMLFDDINDPEVGWQLRKTLQTERRIMLLGSATSRFNEIDDPQRALYDLFRVVTLRPLTTDDCLALWEAVAGSSTTFENVRPLEILTGGNPRLIAIIARFGSGRTFQELMDNLLDLVDDHTEYFKSHLEHLPPQERRVYLALARLWKPATTKEVADLARVGTNQCSSLLKRLTERGAVTIEGGTPRRRQFYLTERLYNIYYLLRRGGGTQNVVQALIDFMISWYSPMELWDIVERTYLNARAKDIPVPEIWWPVALASFNDARVLEENGDHEGALAIYDRLSDGSSAVDSPESRLLKFVALGHKALLLALTERHDETIKVCEMIIGLSNNVGGEFNTSIPQRITARAFMHKGDALTKMNDPVGAIKAWDEALVSFETLMQSYPEIDCEGEVVTTLFGKSMEFMLNHEPMKATATLDLIIAKYSPTADPSITKDVADALSLKSVILHRLGSPMIDDEISLLLELVAQSGLREPSIAALVGYVDQAGPAVALKKIQQSEAEKALLPFVTALQRELGQTPRVAKEIDEIAKDIRDRLAHYHASTTAASRTSLRNKPSS